MRPSLDGAAAPASDDSIRSPTRTPVPRIALPDDMTSISAPVIGDPPPAMPCSIESMIALGIVACVCGTATM